MRSTKSNEYTDLSAKQQRIDLRTTPKVKDILTYAAQLTGVSLSTFMTQAAYEIAQKIIAAQEILTLTPDERDRFLSLLKKPKRPNATLKSAMQKYLNEK